MRSLKYLATLLPLQFLSVVANLPQTIDGVVFVTETRTITLCPILDLPTCWDEDDFTSKTSTTSTPTATTTPLTTSVDEHPETTTSRPGHGTTTDDGTVTTTRGTGTHHGTESTTEGTGTSTHDGHATETTTRGTGTSTHDGHATETTTRGTGTSTHDGHETETTTRGTGTSTHDGHETETTTRGTGTSTHDGHETETTTRGTGTSTHDGHATETTTTKGATGTTTSVHTTTGTTTGTATTSSTCAPITSTAKGLETPNCNSETTRNEWCGRSVEDDTHVTFHNPANTIKRFNLVITAETIDLDGTPKPGFAINGKTPGPAIVANWGDTVEITVTNLLPDNATTIHWHGIRQVGTNDQDGVPGVTECGIAPGKTRVYKWHASTYGTGWYHSHTLAQYGGGIRGPVIIHGPATANYDLDMGTVMVDETFSQTIFQMAYNIARVRGALPPGTNYLLNGKNLSPDGTKGESTKWVVKKGKKHLFRIINSSAQSAYAVRFDSHKMKVISADFTPIVPYDTDTLWIQSGQRYNVIVDMDQPTGAYFLRAVSQTGCGSSNLNNGLGRSNGVFIYEGACPTPAVTNVTLVTAGDCKAEPAASLVPIVPKTAGTSSTFLDKVQLLPGGNAAAQVFDGHGSVIRWFLGAVNSLSANSAVPAATKAINVTFDEPTLKTLATLPSLAYNSSVYSNAVVLEGDKDNWVYFVIQNNFQTSHPMHLHGHDFSVLGQGRGVFNASMVNLLNFNNPIRRDTTLLFGIGAPGAVTSGWTVIGFQTDNPGAWVMHCHLIWHADGGMGLQYIERPAEIDAVGYYGSEFQGECAEYEAYEANGGHVKHPYEAGIKRHLEEHRLRGHAHANVVRHS